MHILYTLWCLTFTLILTQTQHFSVNAINAKLSRLQGGEMQQLTTVHNGMMRSELSIFKCVDSFLLMIIFAAASIRETQLWPVKHLSYLAHGQQ